MNKVSKLVAFAVLSSMIVLVACQGKKSEAAESASNSPSTPSATETPSTTAPAVAVNMDGKKTFETYCILCHGADGKLGLNGSKDLSISTITLEERITQVTNGKGTMTPFKDILTEAEIKDVAEYTLSLKK